MWNISDNFELIYKDMSDLDLPENPLKDTVDRWYFFLYFVAALLLM